MESYRLIQWSYALSGLAFIFAFGAIVGSFINVVVYRLPRGLNVVTPPSSCPACGTRLTWRENFPIFGWLWLRGRCRFCRTAVSAEYPIIEAVVAALFSLVWILTFMSPSPLPLVGLNESFWRPDFAAEGLRRMWPMLLVIYALLGSFVAATLIDARTFTIPLALPWFATAVGLVVHPLHALWLGSTGGVRFLQTEWAIPVPTGGLLGTALGAGLGVVLANVLMRAGLLRQSFADYAQWEEQAHKAREAASAQSPAASPASEDLSLSALLIRTLFLTGPAVALMTLGLVIGMQTGRGLSFASIGMLIGLVIGVILRRLAPGANNSQEPIWVQYPHARREMVKEIAFLTPIVAAGALGWWLTRSGGPLAEAAAGAPLWVLALGGSIAGYLVGGGIVWVFRIGGSLALGKEAMGLGDVHLMAAAGACLGWIDPLLAFFVAPFLGIGWAILSVFFRQLFHREGTALPYGPHLAAATLMVLLAKPVFELGLSLLLHRPVNIP